MYAIGSNCCSKPTMGRSRWTLELLAGEVVAGARIRWMFTTEKARAKMGRAYPQPASPDGLVKPSKPL